VALASRASAATIIHLNTEQQADAALLEAWRRGDKQAGKQLFVRHGPAVARFFRNKFRTGADDLIQLTFLRLLESKGRIRDGVVFRSFLLGVARNIMFEHLRAKNRGEPVNAEVDTMATLSPGPSTLLGRREEHRLLLEALRRLPIEHQIALELFYWEGYKTAEIAAVMGISGSAMRSRLSKARELLNATMEQLASSSEVLASTVNGLETWAKQIRGELA